MSVKYKAVNWNPNKRMYDATIVIGVLSYLATFITVGRLFWNGGLEVLLIRALGTCGILMLHIVLCIGPLARLDRRLLPVLYNRRHLGVATFLVGLAHGLLATGYYHGFGQINPLVSLLSSNTNFMSWMAFPFEFLGIGALAILFLLAATSHDFWQKNLGASVWKSLHMAVYVAYALLVMHVVLGALASERSWFYAAILAVGLTCVVSLHLLTAWRERRKDGPSRSWPSSTDSEIWIDVASVEEIPDSRAKVVCLPGRERVAVFRYGGKVSAVTNVCAHQRGPLGEGKIVDGCITCPWHGWEYRPENGCSPPPFVERIATYRVRVEHRRVLI
ncbi:MAG: ferric reductase-like transmembrane domain-containing protein, partial [Planctomycetaceae bacterium]|nr:ferric reductase-like transmembrane domain-containing protein [Planctomycetaceae bacterium]